MGGHVSALPASPDGPSAPRVLSPAGSKITAIENLGATEVSAGMKGERPVVCTVSCGEKRTEPISNWAATFWPRRSPRTNSTASTCPTTRL